MDENLLIIATYQVFPRRLSNAGFITKDYISGTVGHCFCIVL